MSEGRRVIGERMEAPQVGLEPTTLRLTVGAEPSSGQGRDASQRENCGASVPTSPNQTPKGPGDSHDSPRADRRQILSLALVAWRQIGWHSVALFRAVFGEGSRGVERHREPVAPSLVPPSFPCPDYPQDPSPHRHSVVLP